jgi:hypothetical protein
MVAACFGILNWTKQGERHPSSTAYSHTSGRKLSRRLRVLRSRVQEIVNPYVQIVLDGGIIGVYETGNCLPVNADREGNLQ